MKKANVLGLISLVMVLFMNLTFTSCNKDDDDDAASIPRRKKYLT